MVECPKGVCCRGGVLRGFGGDMLLHKGINRLLAKLYDHAERLSWDAITFSSMVCTGQSCDFQTCYQQMLLARQIDWSAMAHFVSVVIFLRQPYMLQLVLLCALSCQLFRLHFKVWRPLAFAATYFVVDTIALIKFDVNQRLYPRVIRPSRLATKKPVCKGHFHTPGKERCLLLRSLEHQLKTPSAGLNSVMLNFAVFFHSAYHSANLTLIWKFYRFWRFLKLRRSWRAQNCVI